MATRYFSKGKGRRRKVIPIKPRKKGVSVRSVSLQPNAVLKINKQQIKLINKGEPATFSKALNQVIVRAKRNGIPIYDTLVNSDDRRKPYHMFVTDMKRHKKVKGSDTIVMAEHYGQAVDDFIVEWNRDPNRMKMQIGYPVVQGTVDKSFRYVRDSDSKKKIKLENRASIGIRAYTDKFSYESIPLVLEIGTHHPKGRYLIEPFWDGSPPYPELNIPEEGFKTFEEAKKYVENRFNIEIELDRTRSNDYQTWEQNISATDKRLPFEKKFWSMEESERNEIKNGETIEQFLKRKGKL